MHIIPIRIIFATSIKHTTKIMLLVDTAKYHNYKIINTMEKQFNEEADISKIYAAFESGETISNEDLKTLVTFQDTCIATLREELNEIHTACSGIGEENEMREEHEAQLEADLQKAKERIKDLEKMNQWYCQDYEKNKQLKEALKAVATLINTILA